VLLARSQQKSQSTDPGLMATLPNGHRAHLYETEVVLAVLLFEAVAFAPMSISWVEFRKKPAGIRSLS
jgi:hypothetical protein